MRIDNIENKHRLYRGEDCMKTFCISLREDAANVKKKMLLITKRDLKLRQDSTVC